MRDRTGCKLPSTSFADRGREIGSCSATVGRDVDSLLFDMLRGVVIDQTRVPLGSRDKYSLD